MDSAKRILLVEDDARTAELLCMHLWDEGYAVVYAVDGRADQRKMERGNWDALVLGLISPGIDGLEICRHTWMQARYTPIIIISTRPTEVHRILGLELSADDYLTKPFSVLELVARVKALTRRTDTLAHNTCAESGSFTLGNLGIEPLAREARVDGKLIELTPHEFGLLHFLTCHPGKVLSRLGLFNQVWGYQHNGYEHTVSTHVNRLRAKVEVDLAQLRRMLTAWGHGYKSSIGTDGKEDAV